MIIKQAAVVLLIDDNDSVLVVNRPKQNKFGLPGGKVEPGETPIDAAVRETYEETGIDLDPFNLVPIYGAIEYGDDGNHYYTTCFLYDIGQHQFEIKDEYVGIEPDLSGKFIMLSEFVTCPDSMFPEYNESVIRETQSYYLELVKWAIKNAN